MEEFMCIMAIYLTDNPFIKEELLKLDCQKLTWKLVRQTGRDAQTRIVAKKIAGEAAGVNKITSNGGGGANGGGPKNGAGAGGPGGGGGAGKMRKKVKCYKCNNAHFARDCTADPSKMKCNHCPNDEAFRRNPHYTGAGFCPKQGWQDRSTNGGGSNGQSPGDRKRLRKIERQDDDQVTDQDYTDTEGENSDDGYERERIFTGRIDLFGPCQSNPTLITLHKKASAVIMFKQHQTFAPTLAEADSGSDFSLMWEGFAIENDIYFNPDDTICDKLMDNGPR